MENTGTMRRFFPILEWLPRYQKSDFKGDLQAGLTITVMLIPQSMAYALLAGVPPIYGLYASVVPLVVYAFLGTSKQLAVGPAAMISLLTATGIGQLATIGSPDFVMYAVMLAFLVGILQILMGIFRVGFLVNFISHPVIKGFTFAASLIIAVSQFKYILGLDIPRGHFILTTLRNLYQHLPQTNLPTVVIGVGSILLLVAMKKWKPGFPAALLVVALSTVVVAVLRLDKAGVSIVGNIPAGLPAPHLPALSSAVVRELIPTAVTIAFVGFMESISVAKAMAARHHYTIDANQEMIAIGAANVAGSLFQAYPVAGGFGRTAVNDQAGARTPLASVVTATGILITLLFFTPFFYYLPRAVLAAIIIVAVWGLMDWKELKFLWAVKPSDAGLLLITFLATLLVGIEQGILIGIGASILAFIFQSTRPHYAILGQLPGTRFFRNVERFPQARTFPEIVILRIDASFYFANANFLRERLEKLLYRPQPLRAVILDCGSVNSLDSTALETLSDIVREFAENKVELLFANVKGPVRDVMRKSGLLAVIGPQRIFLSVADAVDCVLDHTAFTTCQREHPYLDLEEQPRSKKYK